MIQVADGLWNEGQTVYFYNPSNHFGMPTVAEFVPVEAFAFEGSDIADFSIVGISCISSAYCYLNRANAVAYGKELLQAKLCNLDDEKEKIQAKIDELE